MIEIIGEGATNPQAQITINPTGLEDLVCACGNYTFTPVLLFKIVPALVSPNGKEGLSPQQVFGCNRCGEIPDRFIKSGWFKEGGAMDSGDTESSDTDDTPPQTAPPIIESD